MAEVAGEKQVHKPGFIACNRLAGSPNDADCKETQYINKLKDADLAVARLEGVGHGIKRITQDAEFASLAPRYAAEYQPVTTD